VTDAECRISNAEWRIAELLNAEWRMAELLNAEC